MNRLDELLLGWQDQSLNSAEIAELKGLLASPDGRAIAAREFFLTGVVLEALQIQKAAGDETETESTPCSTPVRAGATVTAAFLHSRSLFVSGSIAVLALLGAWFIFWPPTREPDQEITKEPKEPPVVFARVGKVQGELFVVNDKQMLPAHMGQVLTPGQGIATDGAESEAIVDMDSLRLKLSGDTTVFTTVDESQPGNRETRLVLEKGDLLVEVTRSLRRKKTSVQTPLGSVVAEAEETSLHVSEAAGVAVVRGEVTFHHKATGKSLRLGEGKYLAMTADGELYASQLFSAIGQHWTTFPRTGLDTTSLGYALAFSPDGKHLAAINRFGQGGGRVGAIHGQEPSAEFNGERCVQFSADGRWLATADQSSIRLHDWKQKSPSRVFSGKDRKTRVQCLAFSPDGEFLAIGAVAGKEHADLEIWHVPTATLRSSWRDHAASITCLAFSPDGKLLASGSLDKTVILWDMDAGQEKTRIVANPAQVVWSLAFAPQGATLAIATGPADFRVKQPGEVILWDHGTGKIRARLHGHSRAVTSVTHSRDGQSLVTGSADATVRFWDVKTARQYGMLKGHKAAPGFEAIVVALSPDGAALATASFDQTVRIWPTNWIRTQLPEGVFRLDANTPWSTALAKRGDAP